MANGRRVAGSIRSLVKARDLQLECVRVLHEVLLVPVLMYGSETMLWVYRWTASEDCSVLGGWIESRMHG